ncbi:hypothetical protein [Mycoplasma nasistruthionis]|uniref:Uncharacterized protein n=1 Tax=Mycoplasma nasistruthionis TaxID=353852 RepID=A0A4Y6I5D9_9MOLU|nr:hypothetical protein [Mycoplasma nasistruthionis]QDF64826.1 hypothetical protein FIV53_00660 [Mycoplasma nasistruthionis]
MKEPIQIYDKQKTKIIEYLYKNNALKNVLIISLIENTKFTSYANDKPGEPKLFIDFKEDKIVSIYVLVGKILTIYSLVPINRLFLYKLIKFNIPRIYIYENKIAKEMEHVLSYMYNLWIDFNKRDILLLEEQHYYPGSLLNQFEKIDKNNLKHVLKIKNATLNNVDDKYQVEPYDLQTLKNDFKRGVINGYLSKDQKGNYHALSTEVSKVKNFVNISAEWVGELDINKSEFLCTAISKLSSELLEKNMKPIIIPDNEMIEAACCYIGFRKIKSFTMAVTHLDFKIE